eukprot:796848-Rhodomonas_salina.1
MLCARHSHAPPSSSRSLRSSIRLELLKSPPSMDALPPRLAGRRNPFLQDESRQQKLFSGHAVCGVAGDKQSVSSRSAHGPCLKFQPGSKFDFSAAVPYPGKGASKFQ